MRASSLDLRAEAATSCRPERRHATTPPFGPYTFYCAICRSSLRLAAAFGTSSAEIDGELVAHGWRPPPDQREGPDWVWLCPTCVRWAASALSDEG
jgi:hypothetical protein